MSVDDNIKLVQRLNEAFERADRLDEFFTPDFVAHDMPEGYSADAAGMAQLAQHMNAATSDVTQRIEDAFGGDDRVCTRVHVGGTHTGELFGIPATNRSFEIEGIEIYRFEDGKVAEYWGQWDMLGLMGQLGVMEQPGA